MRSALANHIDTLGGLVGVDTKKYTDSIRATPVTGIKKKMAKNKKHH